MELLFPDADAPVLVPEDAPPLMPEDTEEVPVDVVLLGAAEELEAAELVLPLEDDWTAWEAPDEPDVALEEGTGPVEDTPPDDAEVKDEEVEDDEEEEGEEASASQGPTSEHVLLTVQR